jgi:AcrR family transcriptional regulator
VSRSLREPLASAAKAGDGYHHGDLRAALLGAARSLAAEVGVDVFTLREVARRAGVSHAAPYHHFKDKAALIRALATEAFSRLAQNLRAAAGTKGSPLKKLQAVGVAYVRFAAANPAEFRFMFRRDLCVQKESPAADAADLAGTGQAAYQVLVDAVVACQHAGLVPARHLDTLALTAWSTVHGLAEILLNGPAEGLTSTPEGLDELARTVIRTLQHGLEVR